MSVIRVGDPVNTDILCSTKSVFRCLVIQRLRSPGIIVRSLHRRNWPVTGLSLASPRGYDYIETDSLMLPAVHKWMDLQAGLVEEVAMVEPRITRLLDDARSGDDKATEALFNAVYQELKGIARSNRRRWQGNATMNTTALIHEVFIKMAGGADASFSNRTHFFATASKAMRQVLVNYAKQQRAAKRGGDALRVTLDDSVFATQASADELLHIHQMLVELSKNHPRRGQIVECRVFGGMSVEETADALSISTATVKRDWRLATAWIFEGLQTNTNSGTGNDP